MPLTVTPSGSICGATVTGVDLREPLAAEDIAQIRAAWIHHAVLALPDQPISDDDLERFSRHFGPPGDDPFIAPVPGRRHVLAVRREADETSPLFAENWHTDWSFQPVPPAGTCLRAITIPPSGGDTLFADQRAAYDAMPPALRTRAEKATAVHSAKRAYAPDGSYGDRDTATRSMDIRPSPQANAVQRHPLIRTHPETGRKAIYGTIGYTIALEGVDDPDALLAEIYAWQTQDRFVHRQRWEPDMLVMWDNRSLLHRATGGYEGHARLLHRTTIGDSSGHYTAIRGLP